MNCLSPETAPQTYPEPKLLAVNPLKLTRLTPTHFSLCLWKSKGWAWWQLNKGHPMHTEWVPPLTMSRTHLQRKVMGIDVCQVGSCWFYLTQLSTLLSFYTTENRHKTMAWTEFLSGKAATKIPSIGTEQASLILHQHILMTLQVSNASYRFL